MGKKIKPFADAVTVSRKDPGHNGNASKREVPQKCTMSFQYKNIHDPRNENQNSHRINMGLKACLHLRLLWEVL